MIFRWIIFGHNMITYSESGFYFGVIYYQDFFSLPKGLQYYTYFENVLKNFVAPFLPFFNGEGGVIVKSLINQLPFWLFNLLLFVLTYNKKLSKIQKAALVIILLNSIIHYSVFRYRTQYNSQLAFSIFIAASTLFKNNNYKQLIVKGVATALLIYCIVWANRSINSMLFSRYYELNTNKMETIIEKYSFRIDESILDQVVDQYKR